MRYVFIFLFFFASLTADPPKVIIFDYGGVIAKVNREPVLKFISDSLNISYHKVKKDFASEKLYKAFNKPQTFWSQYAKKNLSSSWFEMLEKHKETIAQPMVGIAPLILKIQEEGIQLALLSNTNKHRAKFLSSRGAYRHFDPVLLSCYLGVRKPDPEIYKKLLDSIKWTPDQCLFIDNKMVNIEAAQKMGIQGIVFESVEQVKKELHKRQVFNSQLSN